MPGGGGGWCQVYGEGEIGVSLSDLGGECEEVVCCHGGCAWKEEEERRRAGRPTESSGNFKIACPEIQSGKKKIPIFSLD